MNHRPIIFLISDISGIITGQIFNKIKVNKQEKTEKDVEEFLKETNDFYDELDKEIDTVDKKINKCF